jgi:glycosyltransferase involved in cell wall biosynthesis
VRVCLIYDCLFPYTVGGAERWYRNLAERLAGEGHEVTYLTLRQWDRGERLDLDPRVRVVAVGPRMALYTSPHASLRASLRASRANPGASPRANPGASPHAPGGTSSLGRRRILPPLVFGAGVLWHLLRHGRRYDVVHTCAFPYFSLLAAALARPLGRYGLVTDWFEVWSHDYWRDYLGGPGGLVGEMVQRLCALVPQRAFCFSRLHEQRLREAGLRGPITVLRGLYTSPTPPTEPATPREADPLVLFAGRLIPEKRVTLGVAAVASAARRIEGLHGVFYGDGPEREALRAAIAAHDADSFISAPGFVEAERLDADMRRALCVLLPSEREGYGMVVVEASAHATPAVVVPAPDNAAVELVEDGVNGAIASSDDSEAIAEAILRVHRAGMAMRQSTARWFTENAERLSLESSTAAVLESYASSGASSQPDDAE